MKILDIDKPKVATFRGKSLKNLRRVIMRLTGEVIIGVLATGIVEYVTSAVENNENTDNSNNNNTSDEVVNINIAIEIEETTEVIVEEVEVIEIDITEEIDVVESETIGEETIQSFAQAFAEARDKLGAGGVFEWNGNLYNTYYVEEWQALSSEEINDFMEEVYNIIHQEEETSTPIEENNNDINRNDSDDMEKQEEFQVSELKDMDNHEGMDEINPY